MRKKKALIVYIILCLCFIYGQSLLPRSQSSAESGFLLEKIIHPFEEWLFGSAGSTETEVRKAAHVFEYMCLGLGLAGLFYTETVRKKKVLFSTLSAGILAALLDETIQLFSSRGSQVSDVWIDACGVVLGYVTVTLLAGRGRGNESTSE